MAASLVQQSRYRTEEALLEELLGSAQIASTTEEILQQNREEGGQRLHNLASSVRVYPGPPGRRSGIFGDLARAIEEVQERLQFDQQVELYICQDPYINASVASEQDRVLVVLTSALVEKFPQEELLFILGHEIGHALFGHEKFPATALAGGTEINAFDRARIRGWQRASEISADRCGLLCCRSLEVAGSAVFRTMSGLGPDFALPGPEHMVSEWEQLLHEFGKVGEHSDWPSLTHPVMLLRMVAMVAFWRRVQGDTGKDADEHPDSEVDGLLQLMDPFRTAIPGERTDLQEFFIWGGLCIALANGEFDPEELHHIESIAPAERLEVVFEDGPPSYEACLDQFRSLALELRPQLKWLEIHAIMEGLITMAYCDEEIDEAELEVIVVLGEFFDLGEYHCTEMVREFLT